MTNEEKAKQIATGNRGYYPDANDFEDYKARYSASLEMAEWKDQQFKEYLEKKKLQYESEYNDSIILYRDACRGKTIAVNEIINELFGEEVKVNNSDNDE